MTPTQHLQFAKLVSALWEGEIGQTEFIEVGLDMGASLTALVDALEEVKAEDGVLQ